MRFRSSRYFFEPTHTRAGGNIAAPPCPGQAPGSGAGSRSETAEHMSSSLSLGFFSSVMSPRPLTTWAAPAPRPAPPPNLGLARRCREERKDLLPGPLASATRTRRAAARAFALSADFPGRRRSRPFPLAVHSRGENRPRERLAHPLSSLEDIVPGVFSRVLLLRCLQSGLSSLMSDPGFMAPQPSVRLPPAL